MCVPGRLISHPPPRTSQRTTAQPQHRAQPHIRTSAQPHTLTNTRIHTSKCIHKHTHTQVRADDGGAHTLATAADDDDEEVDDNEWPRVQHLTITVRKVRAFGIEVLGVPSVYIGDQRRSKGLRVSEGEGGGV